jgi:SAM-dependent methyltransferase
MPSEFTDAYRSIVSFYDLEHDAFEDDLWPVIEVARQFEAPVLELGCGSGRVMQALVERDLRVTGVDRSEPMLVAANARLATLDHGDLGTVINDDMRSLRRVPGASFGVVAYTLNALMHMSGADDQLESLRSAKKCLVPGGVVYIDVMHPHPEQLTHLGSGVILEGSWAIGQGRSVDKWSHRRVHASEQIIETDIWYDVISPDGELKRHRTSFDHRYVHANELRLMLMLCGYTDIVMYGSYDFDPFESDSDRLIVMARRNDDDREE